MFFNVCPGCPGEGRLWSSPSTSLATPSSDSLTTWLWCIKGRWCMLELQTRHWTTLQTSVQNDCVVFTLKLHTEPWLGICIILFDDAHTERGRMLYFPSKSWRSAVFYESYSAILTWYHCFYREVYYKVCVFAWTGYQIEAFNNPADFFMDVTNGEAKSTFESITEGTLACVMLVRGHVEVKVKLN